ncbi:unnamed protein product [Adineta steineri]|uniref:Glucose-methanol-choline oxidoreductase N-terminal domain-containing protein n=1 Tax=Adineta steineri TaxID=433720 RepID=A0A815SLR6_9BILA|nr:unnamed protein product [Adineta steineri]CAF1493596.1 unnamed protein product [Adineta steineri]CAF3704418.1 unnamed protein product [Adineta steineri]CAF3923165.1 unnamed protein product [Adineta steineri]
MSQTEVNVNDYDYIVIGGGTAGTVVARRLAEAKANYSVCLLEAGPSDEDAINSHIPARFDALIKSKYDWNYDTAPQKAFHNHIMAIPRGRLLGGCSAMNGTLICRGAKADYDRIASMGNPGWSWNDMLPFFKASETFHPVKWHQADMSVHGTDGPLHTEPHPGASISEKVLQSFIDCDYDYKPDMFAQGEFEGVGHAIRTVHKGIRSTSASFVHNFPKTNLTVRTGIFVDRIILEKNNGERQYKAIGVETHDDITGEPIIFKARKEIILSAGAYNSPMILMHSGIGCKKHLAEVNTNCKVDLPGVGNNLLDHPIVYTSYQVNDPSLTFDRFVYHDPNVLTSLIQEWHENKTGFLARFPFGTFALKRIDKTIQDPIWETAKSLHTHDDQLNYDPSGQLPNQPHIEFWNTELYFGAPHIQHSDDHPVNPINGEGVFTLITLLCAAQQRGTVRLSSNDPTDKPIIDHAHLTNELDVAILAEGCRLGHEVLLKGCGTKDIISGLWPKTTPYPKDTDGWKEHVRTFSGTCFHPGGTCKMAPDNDPMGVVDNRLRVRNVAGLRVADISILPLLNSGHTQAPAYAIGEKVAHMVLQDIDSS